MKDTLKPEILAYIATQRVCVVALEMPDGSPHAATVHFAHKDEPFAYIVQTSPDSRKGEAFLNNYTVRASLVVGLEEAGGKEKTFQMDGTARVMKPDEDFAQIYLDKFPRKEEKYSTDIFLVITPTWWRFTDWSKPEGKTIFTSDGTISVGGKLVKG